MPAGKVAASINVAAVIEVAGALMVVPAAAAKATDGITPRVKAKILANTLGVIILLVTNFQSTRGYRFN
jgi:hypothetical protein